MKESEKGNACTNWRSTYQWLRQVGATTEKVPIKRGICRFLAGKMDNLSHPSFLIDTNVEKCNRKKCYPEVHRKIAFMLW
jgi:hypothetical protein